METLRVSIGDNDILGNATNLHATLNWIAIFIWLLTVLLSNIVLLNFIIAEACACYSIVAESLEAVIWREKASMI